MAADAFLPAFAGLIFFPEQLMPNSSVQLRLQGQDCRQKVITVHSAVTDGLISRADHTAGLILRQAAAVVIVGAFLLSQAPDAADDLLINLVRGYRPPFSCFFFCSLFCCSCVCCRICAAVCCSHSSPCRITRSAD